MRVLLFFGGRLQWVSIPSSSTGAWSPTDTYASDIAVSNGKIEAIGNNLPRDNAKKIIDAANRYVLPGGIDVHTHLDMPFGGTTSADDFETGTRAAAFGGT